MSLDNLRFVSHGANCSEFRTCTGRAPKCQVIRQGLALGCQAAAPLHAALSRGFILTVHPKSLPRRIRNCRQLTDVPAFATAQVTSVGPRVGPSIASVPDCLCKRPRSGRARYPRFGHQHLRFALRTRSAAHVESVAMRAASRLLVALVSAWLRNCEVTVCNWPVSAFRAF